VQRTQCSAGFQAVQACDSSTSRRSDSFALVARVARHRLQIELMVPSGLRLCAKMGRGDMAIAGLDSCSYPFGSSYIDPTLISLEPHTNRTKLEIRTLSVSVICICADAECNVSLCNSHTSTGISQIIQKCCAQESHADRADPAGPCKIYTSLEFSDTSRKILSEPEEMMKVTFVRRGQWNIPN
jgi:hypothetical protein